MPQNNHKTAVMFPTFEFPTSSWHLSAVTAFSCTGHWPELKSSGPNWEEVPQAWQLRLWDPKAADGPITDITSAFRKGNNMLEMLEIAIHSNPFHPIFGSVGNKLNAMEFLWIKIQNVDDHSSFWWLPYAHIILDVRSGALKTYSPYPNGFHPSRMNDHCTSQKTLRSSDIWKIDENRPAKIDDLKWYTGDNYSFTQG